MTHLRRVPVVVIGAGHAGLAMSHRLTQRSLDHVVLERTQVASSWSARRPSLRLLTPNWQTRLPGAPPSDLDPEGFASAPEVAQLISGYAEVIGAPIECGVEVERLSRTAAGFLVESPVGAWECQSVVLATGAAATAVVPPLAAAVPSGIVQLSALDYRGPDELPEGGVLVVGAAASGVQIADELVGAGRPVTLAVGEHVRMPRRYRDRDIFWWLEASGVLDTRYDEVDDLARARHLPSPQLIGSDDHRRLDVNSLRERGVRLVGRLTGIADGHAQFSGALSNVCRLADLKMDRLLDSFDDWAAEADPVDVGEIGPVERFESTRLSGRSLLTLRLDRGEIGTIVWATGFRPDHSWLNLDVLDRKGCLVHDGGVVEGAAGVYAIGLPVLRRRRSTYVSGAGVDSCDLAAHLHRHLDLTVRSAGSASA